MHISALLLPLSCTVNTVSTPIIEKDKSVFGKNDRFKTKINLPPLALPVTTVQLDAGFIVNSSSEQAFVNTTEIEDG